MRAYRIAEGKQVRIDRVSAVLRDNSVDCNVNLNRIYFDRDRLGVTTDVVTSQHVEIRGYKIGDDPSARPRCAPSISSDSKMDISTYDPEGHAFHQVAYSRSLRDLFASLSDGKGVKYAEVWAHVVAEMGADARPDGLSAALQRLLEGAGSILDARGREGRVIYRSGAYVFQPDDEDTTYLTERERVSKAPPGRRLFLDSPGTSSVSNASDASDASEASEASDAFDGFRVQVDATLASLPPGLRGPLSSGVVDMLVDRMRHEELTFAVMKSLSSVGTGTDLDRAVLKSLTTSGVLAGPGPGRKWTFTSPEDGQLFEFVSKTRELRPLPPSPGRPEKRTKKGSASPLGLSIPGLGFRIIVGTTPVGCADMPPAEVERIVRAALPGALHSHLQEEGGHESGCALAELALRVFRSARFLRGTAARVWMTASISSGP